MNGLLILGVGVLVLVQLTAGSALQRLGVIGDGAQTQQGPVNVDPDTGIPNTNPSLPPLTDSQGRPY